MTAEETVFISFKTEDKQRVLPFLKVLETNGIKYWWQEQIHGRWGDEIEVELKKSKFVLGFLSERSMKSPGVFAECSRGNHENKLLPIRIDNAPISYEFDTLIALTNYYNFSGHSSKPLNELDPELVRLISRLKADKSQLVIGNSILRVASSAKCSFENWFEDARMVSLFPYAMSLCVFENCEPEQVQWASVQLQKVLSADGFKAETFGASSLLRNSEKLQLIRAQVEKFQPDGMPYSLKYIRFIDSNFKAAFLEFVWREMDQLRDPIIEWLKALIELEQFEVVQRVAHTLSLVARNEFSSVYGRIILPWLKGRNPEQTDCADLALSFLGSDANVLSFVENSLEQILLEANHISGFDLVFRLMFGYTGMMLPEVAFLKLMRVLEVKFKNEVSLASPTFQEKVLRRLQENLNRLAGKANEGVYAINAFRNVVKYLSILIKEKESANQNQMSIVIALKFLAAVTNNLGIELQKLAAADASLPTAVADFKKSVVEPTQAVAATESEPSGEKEANLFTLEALLSKDGRADEETIDATAYILCAAVSGSDIAASNFAIDGL